MIPGFGFLAASWRWFKRAISGDRRPEFPRDAQLIKGLYWRWGPHGLETYCANCRADGIAVPMRSSGAERGYMQYYCPKCRDKAFLDPQATKHVLECMKDQVGGES